MRKELHNTKVTVRLRKSVYRNEWYLYIESYPVYTVGKSEPQRVCEYLNRIVTTVVWDKSRTARTTSSSKSYKPKRDLNGVIQCKSEVDQEACIYADEV
ncbi:Arm DNA-binding domain-containing protein, partial [Porphyromonas loveana]|uniref:Arm DNA-binding domain-containing protein n=1 Tax=Porphyromonas loveana TaxID=1884669 RepID=UPI0035A07BF4